jgi:membrane protein required for colicin V production
MGKLVKSTGLSGTDRLMGLVFGLLRGVALACVLVLLLGFTAMPRDPWWRESRLLPEFQRGAEWLRTWLPATVAQHVNFGALIPSLPGMGDNGAPQPAAAPAEPESN